MPIRNLPMRSVHDDRSGRPPRLGVPALKARLSFATESREAGPSGHHLVGSLRVGQVEESGYAVTQGHCVITICPG